MYNMNLTKEQIYNLIEMRDIDDINMSFIRKNLIDIQLSKLLYACENKEVYVLGHNNPDADSLIPSYILNNILKSLNINSHFCILNNNYNYTYHDKKLLEENYKR